MLNISFSSCSFHTNQTVKLTYSISFIPEKLLIFPYNTSGHVRLNLVNEPIANHSLNSNKAQKRCLLKFRRETERQGITRRANGEGYSHNKTDTMVYE